MGLLKKRKTYTSADTQNIYNDEDFQRQRKEGRLVNMHQYLADTSGKYAWELDVDLVDYISNYAQEDNTFINAWENARKFSLTRGYDMVDKTRVRYGEESYSSEARAYPIIPIKTHDDAHRNLEAFNKQVDDICKILNWEREDLEKQIADGFGGEWGNIRLCVMGLFVEFPDGFIVDKYQKSKGLATYLYTLFERYGDKISDIQANIGVDFENHIVGMNNDTFKSYQYITSQPDEYDHSDVGVGRGDVWMGFEKSMLKEAITLDIHVHDKDPNTGKVVAKTIQPKMSKISSTFVGYSINKIDPNTGVKHTHRMYLFASSIHGIDMYEYIPVYYLEEDVHAFDYRGYPYTIQAGAYFYNSGSLVDYIPNFDSFGDLFIEDLVGNYFTFDPKNPPENFKKSMLNSWITERTLENLFMRDGVARRNTTTQELDFVTLPLDASLMDGWSVKDKAQMIRSSLSIAYIHQVTVKVYRGWVSKVIKIGSVILAAVVFIKSFGSGAKVSAALLKAGAVLASSLAIDKLIDFAIKLGIISPRVGIILRAVIAIVMMAYGNGGFDFTKLLTAPNIMSAVNHAFNAYNKLQQLEINQINQQMNEHNTMHAKRVYELQEKQKLHMTGFSPYAEFYLKTPSYTPKVDLFETVEMMYARHYGYNVVAASQGLISHLTQNLYTGKPKLYQMADSSEDLQDMLIIS